MEDWGLPLNSPVPRAVVAITAELAANAAIHGPTPGRDFEVRLSLTAAHARVEVSDTRPERLPPPSPDAPLPSPDTATTGGGLFLVNAFATRWGCERRTACVKTFWAECSR